MKLFKSLPPTLILLVLSATQVFAAADSTINVTRPSQVTFENLGSLIGGLVGLIIIVALLATFLFLILGGITWITSGGDKSQVETARDRITNALIGLAIVAASWAIMKLIGFFFGIDPFALNIPTVKE